MINKNLFIKEKIKCKKTIFFTLFVAYCILSYVSSPVDNILDVGVIGDTLFGLIISAALYFIIIGIINYKTNSLNSALLAGGIITIAGMGVYGLLNNTLELNLSTRRDKIDSDHDIVVIIIGLNKPQYTRTRILDTKIDLYRKSSENSSTDLLATKNKDSIDTTNDKNITSAINRLTKEFTIRNDRLTNQKANETESLFGFNPGGVVLVPGDKVSYELPIVVCNDEIVRFDIAILGQQVIFGFPIRWSKPQWTSSVVSFHTEKNEDK